MRSSQQTRLFQQLLERLASQLGVPTPADLQEIERLLEATGDVPLSEDELRLLHAKVREIHGRWDADGFHREVGRRLAAARSAAGFSMREVADRLRLTQGELHLIEAGEQPLSFLEAAQLTDLYDISLDGLVQGLR